MKLLEKLTQSMGVSGYENEVRDIICEEIKKYCDEIDIDAMGNVIAHKKGKGKRVMLAAHMDEIGVIATFIDDKGFIRFSKIGGIVVKELSARRVRFANGTVGVIGCEETDKITIDKLYIDIGATSREEAEKLVKIGDVAAFVGEYHEDNNRVVSKALDNRAGCYILIEAMKKLQKNKNDLYFVFTSQEEVGLRGAKTAAYTIAPEYAIAIDVTDTGDTPSAPKMAVKLGGGAAIKVMDRSILCDIDVREAMIAAAKKLKADYQLEIMTDGGTDAGAIHLSRDGAKTGGISLPVRYIHSVSETACVSDITSCIKLLAKTADML